MKKLSKLLLLFCFLCIRSMTAFAQYGPNDLVLSTQAQVDAFDPSTLGSKNLVIAGANIQNLSHLNTIQGLGNLTIENNTILTNLSGLDNLEVTNTLKIANNPALTSITMAHFSNAPFLTISNNDALVSLSGFPLLTSVGINQPQGGLLLIEENDNLTSITGFNGLVVGERIYIQNNKKLSSITGFQSLTKLVLTYKGPNARIVDYGVLSISGNDVLENIDGFLKLYNIGFLEIKSNAKLKNLHGLSNFTTTTRVGLTVSSNALLENLDGLAKLANFNLNPLYPPTINLDHNPVLTSPCGFATAYEALKGPGAPTNFNFTGSGFTQATLDACYGPASYKPQGLYVAQTTSNTATIKWDVATDPNVVGYNVYLGSTTLVAEIPKQEFYTVVGLSPSTLYNINLRAKNSDGNVSVNVFVGAQTKDPEAPIVPLVDLRFNEVNPTPSYSAVYPNGRASAGFVRNGVALSTLSPALVGGGFSYDYGVTPTNNFIESTAIVQELKNLEQFTITGWVNAKANSTGAGGNRIVSWINSGGDGVDLVYQSNGSLRLGVDQWPDASPAFSSPNKVTTNASAPAANWIFFAVTYQSNGQVQYFFGNNNTDVALDVTRTYSGRGATGSNIGKFSVGSFNDATRGPSTYDRMFRGLIDDIKVFDYVLSPAQILTAQGRSQSDVIAPTAPTELAVTSKTSSSVSLTWQPSFDANGIASYTIYSSTTSWVVPDLSTTYTITGLSPNVEYQFTIKAKDSAGNESAASNSVAATTTIDSNLPIVRLNFSESGATFQNSGTSVVTAFGHSITVPYTVFSSPSPNSIHSSIDFGTGIGNYYVESPTQVNELKNLTAFTITGWLNNKSSVTGAGGNRVVSWINSGGDGVDLVYRSDGSLQLGVDQWPDNSPASSSAGKVTTSAAANGTVDDSNWVFFAVTYESNGQVRYYFGKQSVPVSYDVAKTYVGPGITGSNIGKLAIGAFNDATRNSGTYDRMFKGAVDDIQVYGSALTLPQIQSIQSTNTKNIPAPMIKLALDEATGAAPLNTGTISSLFTRSSPKPYSTTLSAEGPGAYGFSTIDGNYYIESSDVINDLKDLNSFTISGWLNNLSPSTGAGGARVVSWINGGADGVDLVYKSDGSMQLGVDQWPDASPAVSSSNKITSNVNEQDANWVFFAVTYQSNGQASFYFGTKASDAVLDVTRNYAGRGNTGSNIGKLAIGNFNSVTRNPSTYDRMFRGFIDNIQIHASALSLSDIRLVQNRVTASNSGRVDMTIATTSLPILSEESEGKAQLYQNYPNPFNGETTIDVYVPHTAKAAKVVVYDVSGRSLKDLAIAERGKTTVKFQNGDLNVGLYFYSLLIDGKTEDTKRMALTK